MKPEAPLHRPWRGGHPPRFAGADNYAPPPLSHHSAGRRRGGVCAAARNRAGAGDVAAVLLRLAEADERTLINRAKQLAEMSSGAMSHCSSTAAPASWRAPAPTARIFSGTEAFAAALAFLKPDRIAGAGGLASRHDAMLAAETGADYVMFGDPPPRPGPAFDEVRSA